LSYDGGEGATPVVADSGGYSFEAMSELCKILTYDINGTMCPVVDSIGPVGIGILGDGPWWLMTGNNAPTSYTLTISPPNTYFWVQWRCEGLLI
jgi:hypothetical protein